VLTRDAVAPASSASATGDAGTNVRWLLGDTSLPAHIDPARLALRWGSTDVTYGQLRDRVVRLAAGLRQAGLETGDRVCTLLHNRGETFELYFACAYAGLTLVPINFRMVAREAAFVLRDSDARMLITEPSLEDVAVGALEEVGGVDLVVLDVDEPGDGYEALLHPDPPQGPMGSTDPHIILYTSGTTGRPKGVMLSHTAITWFALQQAALYPAMDRDMVMLLTGPTFNTASINEQSIPTFLVGGTVTILPSGGWTPQRTSDLIDRWGCTHAVIFPGQMEQFLDADSRNRIGLESMRFALTGGENCPTATVARFRRRWDHVSVAIGYGLTEAGVITWIRDDELDAHPDSVGRAFGAQTFRVVDPDGTPVPAGVTGEVVTAAPVVTSGYWNAPDLTDEAVRDGWLWTGDLGRVDEDDYLYISGRSKDMIISGGQNIYPAEIENALSEHTGILEATIIGVPDPKWGETVCALIVPKEGVTLTDADIVSFVQERLASYKKPRHVVFMDSLPRNPSGKVLKRELRERFADLGDARDGT